MWTYIKRDAEGDYLPGERDKFPAPGTVFLAFDSLRWAVVIGITERPGGCASIFDPQVCDDCNIIAFAPLSETSDPDMEQIHASSPWHEAAYTNTDLLTLLR